MATVYVKAGGAVPSARIGTAASNTYIRSSGTPSSSGSSSARMLQDTSGGLAPGASGYLQQLQQIAAQNNAWSAQQAQKQMDFQQASADKAMQFNAEEAEKNRKWQEMMSNTAHQREVKDLLAAGINPVLTATGGQGAPVTSGATASGYSGQGAKGDTDTSVATAFTSLLGSMLSAQTHLASTAMSAQSNQAIADKTNALNKFLGELHAQTQLSTSSISAAASRYAADRHVDASYLSSSIAAAAARYGYDVNAMTQRDIAGFNAQVNADLQRRGFEHDFDIKEAFPSNSFTAVASLIGQLLGDGSGLSGLGGVFSSAKANLRSYLNAPKHGKNGGGRSSATTADGLWLPGRG